MINPVRGFSPSMVQSARALPRNTQRSRQRRGSVIQHVAAASASPPSSGKSNFSAHFKIKEAARKRAKPAQQQDQPHRQFGGCLGQYIHAALCDFEG